MPRRTQRCAGGFVGSVAPQVLGRCSDHAALVAFPHGGRLFAGRSGCARHGLAGRVRVVRQVVERGTWFPRVGANRRARGSAGGCARGSAVRFAPEGSVRRSARPRVEDLHVHSESGCLFQRRRCRRRARQRLPESGRHRGCAVLRGSQMARAGRNGLHRGACSRSLRSRRRMGIGGRHLFQQHLLRRREQGLRRGVGRGLPSSFAQRQRPLCRHRSAGLAGDYRRVPLQPAMEPRRPRVLLGGCDEGFLCRQSEPPREISLPRHGRADLRTQL